MPGTIFRHYGGNEASEKDMVREQQVMIDETSRGYLDLNTRLNVTNSKVQV
jgi:hypothetical protein